MSYSQLENKLALENKELRVEIERLRAELRDIASAPCPIEGDKWSVNQNLVERARRALEGK